MSKRPYLIDKLIPANEVSLIFGPPGAGKTRYLFELVLKLLSGEPIRLAGSQFDIPHVPVIGYASYDRSAQAAEEILESYDLQNKISWHSFRNIPTDVISYPEPVPLDRLPYNFPSCDLIIVDGLGMIMSDPNKYNVVSRFLRYAGTVCSKHNITIIGNLHSSKERSDSKILNPRQKSLGSTAFSGTTECQIYLSHTDPSDPTNPNRTAVWMPHTSPSIVQDLTFTQDGRLIEVSTLKTKWDQLLNLIPYEPAISREAIQDEGDKLGLSSRSVDRWLYEHCRDGILEKPSYGYYKRRKPS